MIFIGAILFVPAGTFRFWQAWIYCGAFFIPTIIGSFYLLVKDPEFLEKRMQAREKVEEQKIVRALMSLFFFGEYVFSGLDHRYGWSHVPVVIVIIGNVLMLVGYLFVFRVFKENRYAASTVEIQEGQHVISTGPYAIVRHPMYLGALPMLVTTPLALGSYWALLLAVPILVSLILRILNEEYLLRRDLPGYVDYCEKVRWRLIPWIW